MTKIRVRKFSGKRLRKCRESKHMSRMRLAKAIGFIVGPYSIVNYENGKTVPDTNVMLALAEALEVQPKELIDAEG